MRRFLLYLLLNLQVDICNPTEIPEVQASVYLKAGILERIGEVSTDAAAPRNSRGGVGVYPPHCGPEGKGRSSVGAKESGYPPPLPPAIAA